MQNYYWYFSYGSIYLILGYIDSIYIDIILIMIIFSIVKLEITIFTIILIILVIIIIEIINICILLEDDDLYTKGDMADWNFINSSDSVIDLIMGIMIILFIFEISMIFRTS